MPGHPPPYWLSLPLVTLLSNVFVSAATYACYQPERPDLWLAVHVAVTCVFQMVSFIAGIYLEFRRSDVGRL